MPSSQPIKSQARSAAGHWPPTILQPLLAFAGLFCLALIIYWPALRAPLIWDDAEMLNPGVRSASGLASIWSGNQVDYFPMTSTTFWLEWQLWGDSPAGYRIANLALHAASAALMFQILRMLKTPGAVIAACIFCVHPVCVGTVAWIAELKNTLSLFFALLTVVFFLRSKLDGAGSSKPRVKAGVPAGSLESAIAPRKFATCYYYLALCCFLLALLSKISVVTLPFILAALDYWRREPEPDREFAGVGLAFRRAASSVLHVAPFFGLSLILGLVNVWFHRHHVMAFATASDEEPLLTRLLGGGYAVWFYLWKAILPLHLVPIYPRWDVNPASFRDWLPGFLWIALLCVCWRLSRARKLGPGIPGAQLFRVIFFGLGFFWLTLLPVLGVVQIVYLTISRVADHLQYLSLIGIAAIAGFAFAFPFRSGKNGIRNCLISIPLLVLLGIASWQRAQLFAHPEQLWRDNIAKNPLAAMAWANLAEITANQGRVDEALDACTESIKLDPGNMNTRERLGQVLTSMGRDDEAIAEYREILSRRPGNARAHNNLGTVLGRKGLLDEARREFETAIELSPGSPDAHKNLGAFFYRTGHYDEAIGQFEQVLRASPNFPGARQALLNAQARKAPGTTNSSPP